MKKWIVLLVLQVACFSSWELAARPVRVGVFGLFHARRIQISSGKVVTIFVEEGSRKTPKILVPGQTLDIELASGMLRLRCIDESRHLTFQTVAERIFGEESIYTLVIAGRIQRVFFSGIDIHKERQFLRPQVILSPELACEQILRSEMAETRELEALKAQAILARSYLEGSAGRHRSEGFDYCDTTHCQFFTGFVRQNDLFHQAVTETAGLILAYRGKIFPPLYTAVCGGRTLSPTGSSRQTETGAASQSSETSYPYPSVSCDFCSRHPFFHWQGTITRAQLLQAISRVSSDLRLEDALHLLASDDINTNGAQWLKSHVRSEIGRRWKWNLIRSDRYRIFPEAESFKIEGWGSGHNVGFCQTGAIEMAKQGKGFREILDYYFPGCEVRKQTDPS